MKIAGNYSNNQIRQNTNFQAKGIHNPQKLLTDKTMQVISSAIAAAGIAGIALQQHTEEYANAFDKEISKSRLKDISADTIAEVLEAAPILLDIILADKNINGQTRCLNDESLKSLVETYYTNPELTESLLLEKNEDGSYKYTSPQINNLVSLNNESSELYDLAVQNPSVKNLIDLKNPDNSPRYGVKDIKAIMKAKDLNPDFTEKLIKQKDANGFTRFNGEQIEYIIGNVNGNNDFISKLLDAQLYDQPRFKPEEIIELNELAKDKRALKLITKLMKPIKIDISHQYSDNDNKEHSYKYQLDNNLLLKYAKNPNIEFSELIKDFKYDKEVPLHIYNIINGKLNAKDVTEILSVCNEQNHCIYRPYLLKQYPELFTKQANQLIEREYKYYNY